MKLKAVALAALAELLAVSPAPAQIVIGPPGPPPGFSGLRVTYKYYYPSYPPPYSQTTIVTPPPRITINNNYYGSAQPILGAGYDQDTRGVDLDLVSPKKPRPAESSEPEPAPAKP